MYTNDVQAAGESRRRRIQRNNLSDTEDRFESRIDSPMGQQPHSRQTLSLDSSSKNRTKEKDFLIHRLSDDQLQLHNTGEYSSNEKTMPSIVKEDRTRKNSGLR